MSEREQAARRFAEVMGYELKEHSNHRWIFWTNRPDDPAALKATLGGDSYIRLPSPDAPLHEHLAFVGRVAEAGGVREFAIESPTYRNGDESFRVTFWPGINGCPGDATDPSWAALLAAAVTKEGTSNG